MKKIAYIGLFLGLSMVGGCTEESLDRRRQEGVVQIALSWEQGHVPAGARLYFYPESGDAMFSRDCPAEGFSGALPVGRYRVIVTNDGWGDVAMRNESRYDKAEFYVLPETAESTGSVAAAFGRAGGTFVCQPPYMASAVRFVESETLDVPFRETVRVSAAPRSHVKHVRFAFKVENFPALTSLRGSFSGVSPSVCLSSRVCSPVSAGVRFAAAPVGDGSSEWTSDISVFDLVSPVEAALTHLLIMDLTDGSGVVRQAVVDLTASVAEILSESEDGVLPAEIRLNIAFTFLDGSLRASVLFWEEGSGAGVL